MNRRAVIYLRVSSDQQVRTDLDGDGLSLDAQRSACQRKAASLNAQVVDEFVERGESGRSTKGRSALVAMLARLKQHDVDYVIVHKVDRLARKRADDSAILAAIQASGAKLVSVSENIDETPSGMLLHGIMASIAEFYSMNLGQEVKKGTTEKARRGGTPFKAPIGYLNSRQVVNGHEVRIVTIDPERGPLIRQAFTLYATGDYALSDLAALLEARGLKSRPTPKVASRSLSANRLSEVLRNDFYAGTVRYAGKVYEGRHEPLISRATFEQVQDVLAAQRQSGERSWRHHHYLRGSVFCAECGGRLFYTRNKGNGGTYEYFSCRGRQVGSCTQPHHRVEAVESAIEFLYADVMLSSARREAIATAIRQFCAVRSQASAPEIAAAKGDLERLARQERKLLDAHYQDQISQELFAEEQARLRRERIAAESTIEQLSIDDSQLLEVIDAALELTDRIQTAYVRATAQQRRLFNQAFFERIEIDEEDVVGIKLRPPFDDLLDPELAGLVEQPAPAFTADDLAATVRQIDDQPTQAERVLTGAFATSDSQSETGDLQRAAGLYVRRMVGDKGLEPPTSSLSVTRSNQLS